MSKIGQGYTVMQYGEMARSTGGRRHVNLLLEGHHEENVQIYGWPAGSTTGLGLTQTRQLQREYVRQEVMTQRGLGTAAMRGAAQGSEPNTRSISFEASVPPASEALAYSEAPEADADPATMAALTSRALADKVRGPRNPSGNFAANNTALFDKDGKGKSYDGENLTASALTLRASTGQPLLPSIRSAGGGGSPAPATGPLSPSGGGGGMATGGTSREAPGSPASQPWLMPWQTGTRDRKMAQAISSKRTPNGSFANLDYSKAIR